MIGKRLMLPDTKPFGFLCHCVYIVEQLDVSQELFLSVSYSRDKMVPVITFSERGGMVGDITKIEQDYPESIHHIEVDPHRGFDIFEAQQVATKLGVSYRKNSALAFILKNMYECFIQRDALQITINPMIITTDGELFAANTKMTIDPDALYRQAELRLLLDSSQMHTMERVSFHKDIRYVDLREVEGTLGVISNGGSLCLATNDYLKNIGGSPVNFMDLGAGSIDAVPQIQSAFQIHETDDRVNIVFVNCYGGNMSMLHLVKAILEDLEKGLITKPIVMRLAGLEFEEGYALYKSYQHNDFTQHLYVETDFEKAAKLAVDLAEALRPVK